MAVAWGARNGHHGRWALPPWLSAALTGAETLATTCQRRRITEIISEVLSLFITTKKMLFKDKNCIKCLLSKSHSSMSNSHDIDKIAISAGKMWQNWVLNSLLTFVSAAFLGISSYLWEGVNFKLTTLKMGDFSSQSNLDAEFLLKL